MRFPKILCVLLSFLIVLPLFVTAAFAEPGLPEGPNIDVIGTPEIFLVTINYHNDEDYIATRTYFRESGKLMSSFPADTPRKALAGWATEKGGPIAYDIGAPVTREMDGLDLWAVWIDLCFGTEEKFSFSNAADYFVNEDRSGYYMTDEDYQTMQRNLFKTYGLGPVPSPILAIVLATFPKWNWQGSCYGMSTVAALQHFGKIDVLSLQDAACVADLEADDTLISCINFYQSQAATSWLTENKAYVTGSPMYRAQLETMFEAVKDGALVLFTFYRGKPFVTPGHTVLLTGAYDNAAGEHMVIAYDCNQPWAYEKNYYPARFTISSDYSTVADYIGDPIGAVNWTKEFDQFDSFSIRSDGSAATWHARYFAHLGDLFAAVFKAVRTALS